MGSAKNAKRNRREQRELIAATDFWHGGAAGRRPGDLILPPSHTGAVSVAGMAGMPTRNDRVYFTTVYEVARGYAAHHRGSNAVYRVEPVGGLEPDPDYRAIGFQAPKARVIEVTDTAVSMTPEERMRVHQPYEEYEDGTLIHDEAGRLLVSERLATFGIDQAYLDANIPLWTELEDAAVMLQPEVYRRNPHLRPPFS